MPGAAPPRPSFATFSSPDSTPAQRPLASTCVPRLTLAQPGVWSPARLRCRRASRCSPTPPTSPPRPPQAPALLPRHLHLIPLFQLASSSCFDQGQCPSSGSPSTGGLQARHAPPSAALGRVGDWEVDLWETWDWRGIRQLLSGLRLHFSSAPCGRGIDSHALWPYANSLLVVNFPLSSFVLCTTVCETREEQWDMML